MIIHHNTPVSQLEDLPALKLLEVQFRVIPSITKIYSLPEC